MDCNEHIIIDACTFINLMKIDEEGILLPLLLGDLDQLLDSNDFSNVNISIPKNVFDEIDKNHSKNVYSKELNSNMELNINLFLRPLIVDDNFIKNKLGVHFDNVKNFALEKHSKENGELFSSALALLISREKNKRVIFYTDDEPAKIEFSTFFENQQIGTISNSIGLYLYLYWRNPNFDKKQLVETLKRLRIEYCPKFDNFKSQLDKLYQTNDRKFRLEKSKINDLIKACETYKFDEIIKVADNSRQYPNLSELIYSSHILNNCKQVVDIDNILDYINKYDIYKPLC